MSEPIYPEYIPLEDEHILLAEEQPLPPVVSPTAESLGITVRLQAAISFPPEAEVERLLAVPTPSPSPPASLSPPSARERLARCTAPAALPSPPLPPPLHMPPPIDGRDDIPETEIPPRKRLCLSTLGSRYEVGESSTARPIEGRGIDYGFVSTLDAEARRRGIGEVGYGIRDTWIDPAETVPELAPITVGEDMIAQQENIQIVENEAYVAREAWAHSIGLSQTVHSKLQTQQEQVYAYVFQLQTYQTQLQLQSTLIQTQHQLHETRFQMQQTEIAELRETNRRRQAQMAETLRGEIKKLEIELWNLKVKENNVSAYTKRFQELTLICTKCFADEAEKIDKYVSRLPDNIYGGVKASKPRTLDETIELDNDLMDQKLHTYADMQSNNKRKANESFRNNHGHQQQTPKRQNIARVYNMGTGERKPYSGNLPKKNGANHKGHGCFECGATGHFKRDCPKLKNTNGEKVNAPGWVYAVRNAKKRGNASRDSDSNVVMGTFLLNNRYASILFDTGADRSFISTAFSSLIDIVPTLLGNSYDVELADVQIPYGNETLTFRGNKSNNGRESRLTVISCSKAQEYMAKGCQIFLAHISAKKEEDKSVGKQLKDVPVIRDYPEVFPKDLPGLPPARPVEFRIDLIPGAATVSRAPLLGSIRNEGVIETITRAF
nr:hypothetical protein [Tanacetum cinerariifolium]